jgi:hypothetical protein
MTRRIRGAVGSYLFELDQGPAEILGVQEQHGLVVRAEPPLARTRVPSARSRSRVAMMSSTS